VSKLKFRATVIFLTVAGETASGRRQHFRRWPRRRLEHRSVLDDDIVGGDKSGTAGDVIRVFSEGLPSAADEKQMRVNPRTRAEKRLNLA